MSEKIVLIDGHSIIHRAFYALPDFTNAEGMHTGAVYGFLMILFKILEEEQPDYLTVAFDVHAPTFRHELYAEYKGTRKPMPEELREQIPLLKEVLSAMDINTIEKEGLEADDILGTLAKSMETRGFLVSLVSGDRDLLQLATDNILVRIPKTKQGTTEVEDYHTQDVIDKYGVAPAQIIDLKALMGDASDNIPGVPGIGEKTAVKILSEFGTLENAYEHIDSVKPSKAQRSMIENKSLATLSKTLATIETNGNIDFKLENAAMRSMYTRAAYELFKRLNFKKFLVRFSEQKAPSSPSEQFEVCKEADDIDALFSVAAKQPYIGFSLLQEEGEFFGISLSWKSSTHMIPEGLIITDCLLDKLAQLLLTVPSYCIGLKEVLHCIHNVDISRITDVLIAAYLINPLKNDYEYDDISNEYLAITIPSRLELIGKKTLREAANSDVEKVYMLGNYQASTAFKAGVPVMDKLSDMHMDKLFRDIEMPLVAVLADMEITGVRVDADELKAYSSELAAGISELENKIYEKAGEEFNINSPKQLGEILFTKLKLPNGKKTKTGYSTAADVLEKLAPDYPFVDDILNYRQLLKLKSTYADGLVNFIQQDGRIHGTFNQTVTATGRISSTEPNLQNIPIRMELGREIRKAFLPADGFVFLDADYSQIELRILASMSGDINLIQAYKDEKDIHRITASQVFHTPFSEVTSLQRRNAKAVNFGIVYGISSFGLSQGLSITRKEAEQYIKSYFETYPGVKAFLDSAVASAAECGYAETIFGRRRPIPELSSGNYLQKSFGERVAMNSPIQGTAADIMKIAMIHTHELLKSKKMKSRIVLQIHDELLIETEPDERDQVEEILNEAMRHAADLAVPLEIDLHEGINWLEAK